jgi:hypothetical protein
MTVGMASLAAADFPLPAPATRSTLVAIQHALIWLVGASGAVVLIEPSPYELVILSAMVFFLATGLRLQPVFIPLLFLLVVVNAGYTVCAISLLDKPQIVNWVLTSWYLAASALFFAMMLAENTERRLEVLRRGLIAGALITSLAGIIGYFRILPGAHDLFTLYGRARGGFKDPNVLAAFLILPAMFSLQTVVTAPFWKSVRSTITLGIISLAVLLAFSRASWGLLVGSSMSTLALMYLTSPSQAQRLRIVIMAIAAIVAAALLVAVLLSLDSVADLFKERASFSQSYDSGRFGRFGRHSLGFQMALDLPMGIGPLQFSKFFPEDTHNSFLNAFMSGGWISGIAFPTLIIITIVMGSRIVFTRVPWQRTYLAIFSVFLGTVVESIIIDIDHWRHFWMMLGTMWAMVAAAHTYRGFIPLNSATANQVGDVNQSRC